MLQHLPLLSLLIWIPVFGAIPVVFIGTHGYEKQAKALSLLIAIVCLLLCVPLYMGFDNNLATYQFREHLLWIPSYGINYDLGVDGIALPLVILSCLTTVIVMMISWTTVEKKIAQYLATFLVMQGLVVGVFLSIDSILFYFFWEAMLIPMYLSIGIWGGANRSYAAIKFFLYTFFGSALLLVAILYLRMTAHSFSIPDFYHVHMSLHVQLMVFLGFLLAFGVKIPLWPLHTWLPDAHTEAPTGGSVVLAALMLKLGAYGILRFMMPIVPDAARLMAWPMIVLSIIAIVYIGLVAIAQTDMKKLIAYSSVAHMGFVTLGCFLIYIIVAKTGDLQDAYMSVDGAMVQMITHAFGSGAMFVGFGVLYHQIHSREISKYGGVAHTMPLFSAFFLLFAMTNVGLPGTAGFVGEFMVIMSAFHSNFWIALLASSTLIIGASYTLWMYRRVFYGVVASPEIGKLQDISGMTMILFGILGFMIIALGVYPNPMLNMMHASVGNVMKLALASHV